MTQKTQESASLAGLCGMMICDFVNIKLRRGRENIQENGLYKPFSFGLHNCSKYDKSLEI